MLSLEDAFIEAEEVGLWNKGYALHKFSGDGSFGFCFCVSRYRDRPIAEHVSPSVAIFQAAQKIRTGMAE